MTLINGRSALPWSNQSEVIWAGIAAHYDRSSFNGRRASLPFHMQQEA